MEILVPILSAAIVALIVFIAIRLWDWLVETVRGGTDDDL